MVKICIKNLQGQFLYSRFYRGDENMNEVEPSKMLKDFDKPVISHESLILPYAVEDVKRKKPFTYDMEVAAILCLAETKRKKLGILSTSQERTSFFSKLYYPIWAVGLGDMCLVVDGLGIVSNNVTYKKPPDVKLFTEDIKSNTSIRKLFQTALKNHAQTFKNFIGETQVSFGAVIVDEQLTSVIFEYIKQEKFSRGNMKERNSLIPPKIDATAAHEEAQKLVTYLRQIQSEIKGFQYAINVLEEEIKIHEQKILCEIEHAREMYESEILRIKPVVEKNVEQLIIKRDIEINKTFHAFDKQLNLTFNEKEKHEKRLQKLERNKDRLQKRMDACKRKKNKSSVARWGSDIKNCKAEISETKKRIRVLSQQIEYINKEKDETVKKLSEEYQAAIDHEKKKITDIEDIRDTEIETKQGEIEELKSQTGSIINQIKELIENKQVQASKLKENASISWKPNENILVCVPFYLIRYETEAKFRYLMYAPMLVKNHEGVLKKIQKTIWSFSLESRIKHLLQPKSETLTKMFTSILLKKMREDEAFEETVHGMGSLNNILKFPNLRETLIRGLEELKNERWVDAEEENAIINTYVPY